MPVPSTPAFRSQSRTDSLSVSVLPREELTVARSLEDVEEAWRLVYCTYRRAGLINPNALEMHLVPLAISPRTIVGLRSVEGVVTSTVSAYADSPSGLPLDCVYSDEIDDLRRQGRGLVEVGMLADASGSRSLQRLLDLMRFPFYFTRHLGLDDLIIGVHPRHVRGYEALFGFEQLGPVKTYPYVKDHPVVLLRLDVERAWNASPMPRGSAYCRRNPLRSRELEDRYLFPSDEIAVSPLGGCALLEYTLAA